MSMTTTATMTITAAAPASAPLPASAGAAEPHRTAAAGICAGKLSLAAARRPCSGTISSTTSSIDTAAGFDPSSAWWLSSDTEHAHTACPLRPFAHMVVALGDDGGGEAASGDLDACTLPESIPATSLAAASIVHLSDALRRKMHGVAPDTRTDGSVGDMLAFVAAGEGARRGRGMGAGLWGVLGWLVGADAGADADSDVDASDAGSAAEDAHTEDPRLRPCRRRPVAQRAEDDPLLAGNEGLGAVEVAAVRMAAGGGGGRCVFALCAHALSADVQAEWLAWRGDDAGHVPQRAHRRLAVVHVAEVSTLHRVAQQGLDALVPPPLPQLEQSFAPLLAGGRVLGPPPPMPALALAAWEQGPGDGCGDAAAVRWLSLLVSRHGLVEMAYPLAATRLTLDDGRGPAVALGGWLGESLFSRIHPDDVVRVVRALRLAWDARPDAYHFARLRRQWQQRRRNGGCGGERITLPERRTVLRSDGVAVANGVAELNVQLRLSGPADLDWADAELAAEHSRFARMRLTRWPLVLRPARASAAEPSEGFVLVAMQPLPEPSAARRSSGQLRNRQPLLPPHAPRMPRCCEEALDEPAKHSISSVASAMTLVGLAPAAIAAAESSEIAGLCRSASCLSCNEATARPAAVGPTLPLPLPLRPHMAARRRSNIAVGSLGASADGLAGEPDAALVFER
ncbi:hypothetical protein GGI15_003928 [Coemansia interrupta]|uniref:Uncharacterized protein n=1 Tax=Coemansia interrupta TaxID=1126814 RepID=A0A9W8HBR5_9FUNG|nr:hypothetical protein GGI15_003928 [Coemansia interrupta]